MATRWIEEREICPWCKATQLSTNAFMEQGEGTCEACGKKYGAKHKLVKLVSNMENSGGYRWILKTARFAGGHLR